MDKLKYDSFYKFLVSLGIILITLPFAGLMYIANFKVTLINQEEYENLSDYSIKSLEQKQRLYELIDKYSPKVIPILFAIGTILFLTGGLMWLRIQFQLDKQVYADTQIKQMNIQQMSPKEVLSKVIKEENDDKANDLDDKLQQQIYKNAVFSKRILKHIDIEEKVCKKLTRNFSSNSIVKSNVRIGNYEFDAVAISKKSKNDIIFEIKNYSDPSYVPSNTSIKTLICKKEEYEILYNRKCKIIFIIVSPKAKYENFKPKSHNIFLENNIEVEYWSEEELEI